MIVEWTDDLLIGIDEIDKEHKDIIDRFHALYDLMREGKGHEYYKELMLFLESYVTDHFKHEEAFQQRIEYPKYKDHLHHHEQFKLEVIKLKETHDNTEITNMDLIKLNLFIKDWLVKHILTVDMELGNYYKASVGS